MSAPVPAPQTTTQTSRKNKKGGSGWVKVVAIAIVALVAFVVLVPVKAEKEIPLRPPPAGFDPGDPVTATEPAPQPPGYTTIPPAPITATTTHPPPAGPGASAIAELIGPDGSVVASSNIFSITRTPVERLRVRVDFRVPDTAKRYMIITVAVAFAPKMWNLTGEQINVWEDGMIRIDGAPARYCITVVCEGATYQPGVPMKWLYKNALYGVYARYWVNAEPGARIEKTFEFDIARALKKLDPYMVGYVTILVGVNIKMINSYVEMRYQSSTVVGGETNFIVDVVNGNVVWVG